MKSIEELQALEAIKSMIKDFDDGFETIKQINFSGKKQGDVYVITVEKKSKTMNLVLRKGISVLDSPIFITGNNINTEITFKDFLKKRNINL